ncbi:PKD domain-containing protein [Fulvivirga sedimenti]|uniref:PKD domain-containing protein n=2 Tax=Fulvivirga sedimenti TaxID=2879465 RepID=A0A9X1KWL3_9BACT|nr:PKD domain-containing protein [Fulvivirga sedimenti]MCA6073337.1 PKD domain-containing protein [Fulvivirga sedimenti]
MHKHLSKFRFLFLLSFLLLTAFNADAQCPDDTLPVSPASASICDGETVNVTVGTSEATVVYRLKDGLGNVISTDYNGNGAALILTSNALSSSTTIEVEAERGVCTLSLLNTVSVTVTTVSAPTASNPTPICEGEPTPALTAAGTGIRWYSDAGLSNLIGVGSPFIPSATYVDNTTAGTYSVWATSTSAGCESTGTQVDVLVEPALVVDAGTDVEVCNGLGVAIGGTPTATGGDGSYTYSWTPTTGLDDASLANPTATPSVTTNYTVTVTDGNGCAVSDAVLVTVNSLPIANAGPDRTVCVGDPVTIGGTPSASSGSGVYSYSWSPAAGLDDPTDSNPTVLNATATTIYTLTVTDDNGCVSVSDNMTVTVNAIPSAPTASNPTPICEGEPTPALTATGAGTIRWYSDAGLTNQIGVGSPFVPSAAYVDNTTAGTYSVWVTRTSAGCESTGTQVDVLVEPALVVDAGTDVEVCNGLGVAIGGTPTATGGDGSYTYSWSPAGTLDDASLANPTASPSVTTNYTVTVTDGNGCAVTDAVLVTVNSLPTANAGPDRTVCVGDPVTIGGTPSATGGSSVYSYSWSPAAGLDDPTDSNPTVLSAAATTIYTLTVTDDNGCVSVSDNMTVTVNAIPSAPTASNPTPICEGEPTPALTATGAGTIRWYSDAGLTNQIGVGSPFVPSAAYVDNTTAGTYSVWATSTSAGCESTGTQVDVLVEPALVVDAGSDVEICIGPTGTTIGGTPTATGGDGSYTYSWTPTTGLDDASLANPTASPSVTTNYTVTVTDGNGCAVTDAVLVTVNSLPTANAGPDLIVCSGDAPQLGGTPSASGGSGVYSYSWSPAAGLDDPTDSNPTVLNATATTIYTLTVTDDNGCVSVSDNMTVTVNAIPSAPTASNPTPICEGEPTPALTATGAGTIRWYSDAGLTNQIGTGSPFVPSVTYVDNTTAGTYSVYVTDTQNSCESAPTQVDIIVNAPPVADAGADDEACGISTPYTLSAVLSNGASTGIWTYTGPDLAIIIDVTDPNTDVFVDSYGTYTFIWEETLNGCSNTDDVVVTFREQPVADAGSDDDACGTVYNLNALPSILGSIGTWSGTGPGNISFNNINSPTATLTVDSYGVYDITWTETNGSCSDAETIQIEFFEPTTADAGSDQEVCDLFAGLSANPSTPYTSRNWTFISGPGTPIITDSTDPSSSVSVDNYGTYVFEWTEVNGPCTSSDQVLITFRAQPTADAGPGGDVCGTSYLLAANPSVGTGVWTYTGPGTATFNNASSPNATVTVDTYGQYDFTWTETNGICTDASTVTVNFYDTFTANAGSDTEFCLLTGNLVAVPSTPIIGTPVGTWSGPAGITFDDVNSPTALVTASSYGTYTLTWTEVNGPCTSVDQVVVIFRAQPTADAGTGGDVCNNSYLLAANPSVGAGVWTYTGPGTATFNNASSPNATVTVDTYGSYDLTWTETNGICSDASTITVNFYEPTVANAGGDDEVCGYDYTLSASLTTGTGTWSGPAGITFDAPNSPTSLVTASAYGTYTLTWTEVNGPCTSVDQVVITFREEPTADAGTGGDVCGTSYLLAANPSVGAGVWTYTGPGTATFNNASSPNATVTVDTYGSYDFTWTETNGICTDASTVTVNFYDSFVANAGADTEFCLLSGNLAAVPSTPIIGTPVGTWSGPAGISFDDVNSPTALVTASAYGTYTLTWTEVNGPCTSVDQVVVTFRAQPTADAGTGGDICANSYLLAANPSVGTGVWTYSGPGTATFNNASSPNATVTVDTYGSYDFTWTETNGTCTDASTITVNFYDSFVANAGADTEFCLLSGNLAAVPSTPIIGSPVGTWSGPAGIGFDDVNSPTALVTASAYGTYTLTWTEVNGPCTSVDQVVVTFREQPVANAGTGGDICANSYLLAANPSVGTGVWTYTGPGTATFNNASSPNATVTVDTYGSYDFTWTETNGICTDASTITVNFYDTFTANAGSDTEFCDLFGNLSATSSTTIIGSPVGTWSGPAGISFDDVNSPTALVTASAYGTYTLTWTEVNGPCTSVDQVVVTFREQPVANAGTGGDICANSYLLAANPSVGAGVWTYTGPGTATFNLASSPNATVTVDTYGSYDFTWTETNGICTDASTITVNFYDSFVANAGADTEFCLLSGNLAAVPSTPIIGSPVGTWSGPAGISFDDVNSPTALVTASAYGTYTLTWTEVNGPCTSVDQVVVTFREQPVANAGTGGDVCGPSHLLEAIPSVGAGVWTYTGPGTATFNNASSPNATVSVDTYGMYDLTWTETNGICTSAATITLNFIEEPTALAGPDQDICGLDVTMAAVPSTGNGLWTLVSGPGTPTYVDATDFQTNITVSDYGTYIFEWTEDNAGCIDSDRVTIRFFQAPVIVSVDNDGAFYCEPASVVITGTIGGGATQANWSIVSGGTGTLSASSITGNVVSATYFPATDEFGMVTFELTTNDPDGAGPCVAASQTLNINITEAPEVNAGMDVAVCEDQGYVDVTGTIGGSATVAQWSGGLGTFVDPSNPVTRYNFDPSEIGSTVILTLTVFDPDGSGPCIEISDNVAVTINPLPIVNFFNLPAVTDEGRPPIDIVGNRAGGSFVITPGSGLSNPRIENGQDVVTFDPGAAVVSASNFITYTYTDVNGCTNSITKSVFVNEITAIDFELEDSDPISIDEEQICQNVGLVRLIGTPSAQSGLPGTEFTSVIPGLVTLGADSEWYFDTNIVTPGLYSVQYTYVNSAGATSVRIKDIRVVGTPVPAFEQLTFCESDVIQFNDISTIDDTPYATTIVAWEWDFGDGTSASNLQNPTHQYAAAGFYDVTFTVTSDLGCSSTIVQNIRVGAVPEVAFDWVGSCGNDPIAFEDLTPTSSLVVPNTITWDFGDGDVITLNAGATIPPGTHGGRTFGTMDMPMHLYQTSGYYDVTLTVVTDSDCQNTSVQTVRASNLIEITTTTDTLYYEDFAAGGADWGIPPNESPTTNSWRWSSTGQGLGSGVWYTGANGGLSYPNENSTIEGPCFNLLGLERPMIAMDIFFDTEESIDGAVMQYSTDGGSSWINLGRVGEGIDWFTQSGIVSRPGDDPGNFNSGSQGWSGSAGEIHSVRFSLDEIPMADRSFVRFRIAFGARSLDNTSDSYFAVDKIFIGNKQRRTLMENFADLNRVASVTANSNIEQIRLDQVGSQGYSDFTLLEYHMNDSGTDSLYLTNTSDVNARSLYYGVNQAPSVFLDGLKFTTPPDPGKPADLIRLDRQSLKDPEFRIEIDTLVSPDDVIRVAVTLTALKDVSASLSLHVAVVETKNEPSAVLNQIMRKLIFGGGGQTLPTAWTAGQTQVFTGEWQIDIPIPNNDKMDIIAFVQNNVTREIYQSGIIAAPIKDTGSGLVTSLEDDIETAMGSVEVYPNPANGYFRIRLPQDLTGTYGFQLVDLRGVTIRSGNIDRTNDTFTISTDSITNGMYYLIITANGQPMMQRKIAIINR